MTTPPCLERVERDGVAYHSDLTLAAEYSVTVAFAERHGGASVSPYASLNLASHVGDDSEAVDENRSRLLSAMALSRARSHLVSAEQVHGVGGVEVIASDAGRGARAAGGQRPIPGTDYLVTTEREVPLLLCYADCVPLILVTVRPVRAVAVVHAGWRGVLGHIASKAVHHLAQWSGSALEDIVAYVGPHIGPCCYPVGEEIMSQFFHDFVTLSRVANTGLDLGSAVSEDLRRSGVDMTRQCHIGICTAHSTADFYSHRAEGITGRHGALAFIGCGER